MIMGLLKNYLLNGAKYLCTLIQIEISPLQLTFSLQITGVASYKSTKPTHPCVSCFVSFVFLATKQKNIKNQKSKVVQAVQCT